MHYTRNVAKTNDKVDEPRGRCVCPKSCRPDQRFARSLSTMPVFLRHIRDEETFCRANVDHRIQRPLGGRQARWFIGTSRKNMYHFLVSSSAILPLIFASVALGLFSST